MLITKLQILQNKAPKTNFRSSLVLEELGWKPLSNRRFHHHIYSMLSGLSVKLC